jgi:copper chaperone
VGGPIFLEPGEFRPAQEATMITLQIPTMHCSGCARGVTAAIRQVDAAAEVTPDLRGRSVAVQTSAPEVLLRDVLTEAGFAPA